MFIIKNLKQVPDTLLQLAQWHQSEWSQLNPGETLEQRVDRMQDNLNQDFIPSTFVAIDHTVLGSATIVKNDMETRKMLSPWLASVYVSPEKRSRGIGSKLVQHVMACAKNNNYNKLYLFTENQQKFYERRSEEHTSELQSRLHLVCRLLLEKKKTMKNYTQI